MPGKSENIYDDVGGSGGGLPKSDPSFSPETLMVVRISKYLHGLKVLGGIAKQVSKIWSSSTTTSISEGNISFSVPDASDVILRHKIIPCD